MKLKYRTTETEGVEWRAYGDNGLPLGPWRQYQWQARLDAEFVREMDKEV